jgi:hypothetical protein
MAVLIIYGARAGYLDTQIKYVVEYYLRIKKLDSEVNRLTVKNDQITIDSIVVHKNDTKFKLDNIVITYRLDLDYKKSKIIADIKINKVVGQRLGEEEFFNAKVNFLYNM